MVFRYIHEWSSKNTFIYFHTIPMIHIGKPSYFVNINNILDYYNHILTEGVSIQGMKEIGKWIQITKKIGLSTQTEELKVPSDISITNIDIDKKLFQYYYNRLPLLDRVKLWSIDKRLLLTKIEKEQSLKLIEKVLKYPQGSEIKLIDPKNHYAHKSKSKKKIDLLIQNTRNTEIQKNLQEFIKKNSDKKYRYDVGILFGDSHMPHVYEILMNNGFGWQLEKKIDVI